MKLAKLVFLFAGSCGVWEQQQRSLRERNLNRTHHIQDLNLQNIWVSYNELIKEATDVTAVLVHHYTLKFSVLI